MPYHDYMSGAVKVKRKISRFYMGPIAVIGFEPDHGQVGSVRKTFQRSMFCDIICKNMKIGTFLGGV